MAIAYRDDPEVDLQQLAVLFRSVGWRARAGDGPRLRQLVLGARWVCSAWDGERLVGFARAISDGVTTAYVSDVVVAEAYRGRGIASAMMRRLMRARDGVQFLLHAEPEMHAFYERFGFEAARDVLRRRRRGP